MRPLIVSIFALLSSLQGLAMATSTAPKAPVETKNCGKEKDSDLFLYQSDFKWDYTDAEIGAVYNKIYQSGKRLQRRAYFDKASGKFKLPWHADQGDVELPLVFVQNVASHVQTALQQGVAEYILFPDMGHSHFFIPQEIYDRDYASLMPVKRVYDKFLQDPSLKVFYHTYEQMKIRGEDGNLLTDPHVQFRYQHRNVVAYNNGSSEIFFLQAPENPANTSRDLPGHFYWGGGFNISASKDGCFYYKNKEGQKVNFDLSLFDLPYQN